MEVEREGAQVRVRVLSARELLKVKELGSKSGVVYSCFSLKFIGRLTVLLSAFINLIMAKEKTAKQATSTKPKNSKSSVGAPSTRSQSSRKGKRAWRKNVDLDEVEEGLEEIRSEERVHGYVTILYH